jgi:cytochrome c-type biogenesis protein
MSGAVSYPLAFVAGLISFMSPCVLPLLPAYLSFMTGMTTAELSEGDRSTAQVMVPALLFVLGFSVIFVGLGASASLLGTLLSQYRGGLEKVAGLAVFAFGLLMLGVIKIPWLYGEARVDLAKSRSFGRGASFVMGMAFAAGWTPCVGPILGTILAVASSTGSAAQGALLLLTYSAGLAVPFLLVALLFGRAKPLLGWLNRHSLIVNRTAGAILMFVGVLIFFGRLSVLANYLTRVLPSWGV